MPSPQSLFVSEVLRRLVKPRHDFGPEVDVSLVRATVDRFATFPISASTRYEPLRHSKLKGEWAKPRRAAGEGPTILYLHGGGYFFCSPKTHRAVTGGLARMLGGTTLALQYRLAPEHRFPAPIEDALRAYRWLLDEGHRPERIVIAGDSAGGGLALATLLSLRDNGEPMPAACALFSPWTDLAATGSSLELNDRNCAMFSAAMIRKAPRLYLGEADPLSPLASPLYADLQGLPPILVHVSDSEVLLDDSTRLAERARQAGVPVELKIWSRQPHVWQVFSRIIPEGRQSLAEASRFLATHLDCWGSHLMPYIIP